MEKKPDIYADNRDDKGRWTGKGNNHFPSTDDARRGGKVSGADRIRRLFEMFDVKPLTSAEAVRLDAWLLSLSIPELQALTEDERQPVVVRTRAAALLDKKTTFEATERLYDRAFGKPTQRQEVSTTEVPPVIVRVIDGSMDDTNIVMD